MPQSISYSRFSSSGQLGNTSEARQLDSFKQWLEKNPSYTESPLSVVDKAKSAYGTFSKTAKHKEAGLGKILEAIEQRKIASGDCLVIESFDRLSREETSEAFKLITSILDEGVNIITLEDGQQYSRESLNTTAVYVLVAKIQASHEYSKRLSSRITAAWSNKRKRLKAGADDVKAANRPIWIDVDNKIKEPEASMAREAIAMYKSGDGYRAIIMHLSKKYPEITPKHEKSIKRWLTNESLAGCWEGVQAFPGLVTLAEFHEIKELAKSRAIYGSPEQHHILSGLIKCKVCGSSYHMRRQKPRATIDAPEGSAEYLSKPDILYSNCSKYLKRGACSNSFTLPLEVAEFVFKSVSDKLIVDVAEGKAVDVLNRKEYSGLVERIQMTRERYDRAMELYLALKGKDQNLVKEVRRLSDELTALEQQKDQKEQELNQRQQRQRQEMSLDDFLEGTREQKDLHNEMQRIINELDNNPVLFNTALKEIDFKIIAGRADDGDYLGEVKTTENQNTYKLIKRSQKLGGYILRGLLVDEDDGSIAEQEYLVRRKPKQ